MNRVAWRQKRVAIVSRPFLIAIEFLLRFRKPLLLGGALILAAKVSSAQDQRPVRIAILDFGSTLTGSRAAAQLRSTLRARIGNATSTEIEIIDPDQARAAARGAGFDGSLNLTLTDARNLGAAIGCDFFIIGDAQTLRRNPSTGPIYYEAFASIFLVSARTGRLVQWERPDFQQPSPAEAEQTMIASLAAAETRQRYTIAIRRAQEDERAARAHAIEAATPVIEPMSEVEAESDNANHPPRPFRRPKPPYPDSAARAAAEATVDVLVDIDARGEVGNIEIVRWAGYGLDESVVETVRLMHFFPAMRDGEAIPMRVLLRYNFRKPPIPVRSP